MSYKDKLKQIDDLQQQIEAAGDYSDEVKKKINYKLRLEWNYHSNSMEGGTLTMEETRSVMVNNITIKDKPFSDVMEMRGHNDVVNEIMSIGKGEIRLSEKRIQAIHKAIVHEENPKNQKLIGNWKQNPNHVINYKGEKFDFTPPSEVAENIHKLLDKTNANLDAALANKKGTIHPVEIAFNFHLEYVTIHPFYDGNGRTARLLSNLLLIALGYPPLIIKTDEKDAYGRFLSDIQAYGGKIDLFYGFMADKLIRSQQLVLDAIAGVDIEDFDDGDKEIELFVRKKKRKKSSEIVRKSNNLILKTYNTSIKFIFDAFEAKHKRLDELFAENTYFRAINNSYSIDNNHSSFHTSLNQKGVLKDSEGKADEINSLYFYINHNAYQQDDLNMFDVNHSLSIIFEEYKFKIEDNYKNSSEFLYLNPPNKDDINKLLNTMLRSHIELIDRLSSES